jgi:hypothetical protein
MRVLILMGVGVLCACSQTAPPAPVEATTPEPAREKVDCAQVSRLARNIMGARQAGVPLEQSMGLTHGDALTRELVMKAYDEPHYATVEMQERVAGDFADQAMLACLKG